MDERQALCRARASELGESQFGTATAGVDTWFALEHDGPWAAKAWEAAAVPAQVRAHVDGWATATSGTRVQLIRRDLVVRREALLRRDATANEHSQPIVGGANVLLLASTRPGAVRVAQFRWAELDDLLAIDLLAATAALREGRLPDGAEEPTSPIVLVCTNGKRDRCCAKWGTPVYESLAADPRVQTWQTTHLGGHRYAATMVWLPAGICHGRVEPDHVPTLVDAMLAERIGPLALLRGRTALSEAAQAAECLWREEHGAQGLDDVVIEAASEHDGHWHLTGRVCGRAVAIDVRRIVGEHVAPPSCGKPDEPTASWRRV